MPRGRALPIAEICAFALLAAVPACAGSGGERARPRAVAPPEPESATQTASAAVPAASAVAAQDSPPAISAEASLGVRDTGIFSDLDAKVQLALPGSIERAAVVAAVDRARQQLVLYERDRPLKVYPLGGGAVLQLGASRLELRQGDRAELAPMLSAERLYELEQRAELPPGDADDDGIPDPIDVLIGAHKTALNADRYDGRYEAISYPGGDVPREIGVCTDVVIRALRNAGLDLQRLVHEDVRRRPSAYPMVRKPDPNIDHRRVKSVLPYFERHFDARSAGIDDPDDPLRAGDVVFMDTFPNRPGTEHVGIVSDLVDANGQRLVINNWTDGTVTKPMELLSWVAVTHRYRVPERVAQRGPIPMLATQLLLVVSESWADFAAKLQRYERAPGAAWKPVGAPIPAVLGHAGYGWGDGLHGSGAPAGRAGPDKREGDGRSPAGVFALGTAYGYASGRDAVLRMQYEQATAAHHCVDDPASQHYNRVVSSAKVAVDWRSAERMKRDDPGYELAIEVLHNRTPVTAAHGSCIFLHVWAGPQTPVLGCTAMAAEALREVARWLRPNAVLVALPSVERRALQREWGLP
jgi:uncharacterized protein YijF (DUF1287 family)/L,D-peptidoglycan transpeptidase YkuD (ErfK/YbiS/YcfS/YnhG family)